MEENSSTNSSRSILVAVVALACVLILVVIGVLLFGRSESIKVAPTDWPWWRGRQQTNAAIGSAPQQWSESANVLWKSEVPGRGHGTPILYGSQIFVATADEPAKILSLLCYDRRNGELLWQTELDRGPLMHKSIKNTYASASAACDGRRVFYPWIAGDALWLAAIDLSGNLVWKKKVAPFVSEHGYASSPCLYNSTVIVPSDNLGPSFLTALDRKSGEIVWQVPRSTGGSYGTPVVARMTGRDQLLLSGQDSVVSYNPANGDVWWRCSGPGPSTIGTIAWRDDLVYATCGAPPMIAGVMAIRADSGRVAWKADAMANVPSPLVVGDKLVVPEDRGTVVCFDAESGDQLWRQRLGGNFSASPVLADGLVYLPNEAGTIFVFRAGEQFESIAEIDLGDGGFASPVIAGGKIYLRTNHHLYCIGDSQ